ncbi:TetR/AcrR family transcriptional regulator [Mycolicibacterium arenosum]|uniref:TetR/AcrR family transcriptional regulator n=1 Tax=Mycolicibacterium arenosum TaxID=2952157 RepID=A0ABT1M7M5_9MYCO|nr:TetR/AcrR family transcriptional regulator [Mycolicibacterium sp. CAU 1645]MCP9275184.1 TetR/AcrR family transcriptional regulator [Mycolicibacterium sp. CAU 1645]
MGKRQDARDRIEQRIVELGREQLTTVGAAGLSVRAIARDLGMVSSAVYRYVASRDELLTLLLVDAYTDLADGVDAARAAAGPAWTAQLRATARAVRRWAVDHPASWALLYGSPVPGYHAPAELTVGPGTRVIATLFDVVAAGIAVGDVAPPPLRVEKPLADDFDGIRAEFGFTGDDGAMARSLLVWAALVGAVSLEVFGQYGADTLTDPAASFDLQVDLLVDSLTRN